MGYCFIYATHQKSAESISALIAASHVTLSVSNAFASMWMVPRLQEAREALAGIELRLHTSDRDLDIAAENIPLAIRGGNPDNWATYDTRLFAPEEIIASVKDGVYAVNFGGGQVVITSGKFVFSASLAYKIENGKITYPLKGATLIGNGPESLTKISMVGKVRLPGFSTSSGSIVLP